MLEKARCLRELAEEYDLHGLYFQHVALCRRRAWLHLMGATHAVHHARVRRGLAMHQTEKRPGEVPKGLGIAPDAIDFERRVVIKRKGSAGARDAVSRQALFYAAFMTGATGEVWRAEVQVYGSRKTALYDLTDDVLDQLIQDARESVDLMVRPPPAARRIRLCDSCSCTRCVGTTRKRAEMDTVIIPRDARLNRHENALVVTSEAGRKAIPLNGVKHVICMGEGSISIRLLKDMGRRGICFTVLDAGGRFLGAFEPEDETPSGRVRVGQVELYLDEAGRQRIAKSLVRAQAHSMRGLLQRYRRNGTAGLESALEGIEGAIDGIDRAGTIEELMGTEGLSRAFLHDAFARIAPDAALERRVRRPPPDPVNCLMSFFNTLLYSACANELAKTHLDRSVSFLHSPGTGRRSLSIDMAEPFRPVLSDALILSLFRRRQPDASWWVRTPGVCLLSEKGRIRVTERFWSRIEERSGGGTLRQAIHRQCLSLEREALGIGSFKPFVWRG